jgi:hypothetical protein
MMEDPIFEAKVRSRSGNKSHVRVYWGDGRLLLIHFEFKEKSIYLFYPKLMDVSTTKMFIMEELNLLERNWWDFQPWYLSFRSINLPIRIFISPMMWWLDGECKEFVFEKKSTKDHTFELPFNVIEYKQLERDKTIQ